MCIFMPKCQTFPLLPLAISGSRLCSLFFVEFGASMKLASTIRPVDSFRPASRNCLLIVSRIFAPSSCFSSRCRNCRIVDSSGVRSIRFRPTNFLAVEFSRRRSSMRGSPRLYAA